MKKTVTTCDRCKKIIKNIGKDEVYFIKLMVRRRGGRIPPYTAIKGLPKLITVVELCSKCIPDVWGYFQKYSGFIRGEG